MYFYKKELLEEDETISWKTQTGNSSNVNVSELGIHDMMSEDRIYGWIWKVLWPWGV